MFISKLPHYRVTSNKSARTFTLRCSTGSKYRTYPMSKEEFRSCERHTNIDWIHWLKCDEYSVIKK